MSFDIQGPLVFGIDISHHNKVVDFDAIVSSNAQFCWCKATEGRTYQDPKFTTYAGQLLERDFLTGAYHYARPDNNTARAEAEHFLRVSEKLELTLLPALDFEHVKPETPRGQEVADWINEWMDIVERETGSNPVLYTGNNVLKALKIEDFYRPNTLVWAPRWPTSTKQYMTPEDGNIKKGRANTSIFDKFEKLPVNVWQYSHRGSVPGIDGNTDLNVTDPSTFQAIQKGSNIPSWLLIAAALLAAGAVYHYGKK